MEKILVVEDSDSLRDVLKSVLEAQGYEVDSCPNGEEAANSLIENSYSLILSDYKLPGMSGMEFLGRARDNSPTVPIVMMTAFGSVDVAVEAMKSGANDFIAKPFEPEDLCSLVKDMVEHKRVMDRSLGRKTRRGHKLISANQKMQSILEQAKKAAGFETPILILGESGVGKELVARFIHEHSARKDEQFVSINCAAIPSELLESEFFGHEHGAFTGSTQSRPGLFEVAKKGTIFLDEVGDMPASLQVKLLRALQEGEIRRVGGNKCIKVNPRIIAATNKNLEDKISNGTFREDFYYRLAVLTLTIPALRQRKEDLMALINYFLEYFSANACKPAPKIDKEAWNLIERYPWPGNIRELENVIERAVILSNDIIRPEHLGISLDLDFEALDDIMVTLPEIAGRAARKAEIDLIMKILQRTGGNKSRASEILGVSYKTLLNKIKEYEITQ
ncbi:MAG: sigma-54-dependent Fis family transcriptional regulator [Deltaproteobacteria bacterium]|nr:sigma-54-dependent Fis family transcriptional regulator [Deltaproteobacteria bacterium]